ncbi:MAG TPA: hypothetical protein DCP31_34565 [Cyanobacteria bacterium UBA8543]|nr:hypothetical protein [Cyanobacteria bacterium UBA8543]
MPTISPTTIINALNELSLKIDATEQRKKRNQWMSYGLASLSGLLFLFCLVIPNKFDMAMVCVKGTCQNPASYKLLKNVYDREKKVNPKGFGLKTEMQSLIPGNEILIKTLAILSTLGMGGAYIIHRKQTQVLVDLKQQRYEMSCLVAFLVNGNVKAYLEVYEQKLLVEKQARIDELLEIDQIERDCYSIQLIKELQTKYQNENEIENMIKE